MTILIKGLNETTLRLKIYRQKIRYGVKEATLEGAEEIAQESEENAPVLTGRLESSHEINDTSISPDVGTVTVSYSAINPDDGFDYGVEMHESFYNLGPESQKKQEINGHIVGRKFLERAANSMRELCVALVRKATVEALREDMRNRRRRK